MHIEMDEKHEKKSNGSTLKQLSNVMRTYNYGDTYTLVEMVRKRKQG